MKINILSELEKTKTASATIKNIPEEKINTLLLNLVGLILKSSDIILKNNKLDLKKINELDPKYDRLKLTPERINNIINDIKAVIEIKSPLGKVLKSETLNNGLKINKTVVPIGVVGVIYESRPNVTFDVFTLCVKSGNACVLKGSKEAHHTNTAIYNIIQQALILEGLNKNIICLLPGTKQAVKTMLHAIDYIDVVIPRGGNGLIKFVRNNSKVPVIETGAGIVHIYYDESGDINKAIPIVKNAKTRRVSVCNALDCLIIHKNKIYDLIAIAESLRTVNTVLFADNDAFNTLKDNYPKDLLIPADHNSYGTEFLSLTLSIKTVNNIQEAIQHIAKYSSKHSEGIIAENKESIAMFTNNVDAAVTYVNASTAFTDGAQLGMGAEIGISTQKLHARGPMGLEELTSYKYVVEGCGHIRTP